MVNPFLGRVPVPPSEIPAKYKACIRAHEWAERQTVSLMNLRGLNPTRRGGRRRLDALWRFGVKTADEVAAADVDELLEVLRKSVPETERALIEEWKRHIEEWKRHEEALR